MHINPDHYLETANGRVITPERNALAWRRCHEDLALALTRAVPGANLYVLIGAQGAGKSTWAKERMKSEPGCIVFDAILVKRSERSAIVQAAAAAGVHAIAVWFQTPLERCVARNAARAADERVEERGIRTVFAALEPPSLVEGFASIWQVGAAET